jgi:hypothetical protein
MEQVNVRTTMATLALALAGAFPALALAQGTPTPLADDPTLIALAVSLSCGNAPDVELTPPPPSTPPANVGPELELVATVRAKALKFDVVPKVDVAFKGSGRRRTVWKTERVNLPVHPEPGVTYHDVAVRLTITSTIEELAELLANAKRASRGIHLETDDAPPPVEPAASSVPTATR